MTLDGRWRELQPLLHPRSIAIIGASADRTTLSGRPLDVLRQHHFPGPIYPVNPGHDEVAGLTAYPDVSAIRKQVDLAVVVVRADRVLEVVRDCAAASVGAAVILTSGFAEEGGSKAETEREIAQIARAAGLRLLGPNCEGFFNCWDGIPVSFSPTVDYMRGLREVRPGNVAVLSQSGGLAFALFNSSLVAGLGVSLVVSTGNEADLEVGELACCAVEDDRTQVVAMLVEGLRSPARIAQVAERARATGKHLVVSKLGRSAAGKRATLSHTAHSAGNDSEYLSHLKAWDIHLAEDQEDLLDIASALSRQRLMTGDRVGIVTTSGGAGIWLADACEKARLTVPELDASLQRELALMMPSYGSAGNPVDVTAQLVNRSGVTPVLHALCASGTVDALVWAANLSTPDLIERETDNLRALLESTCIPVAVYSYNHPAEANVRGLAALDVPWYASPRRTARALTALRAAARSASRAEAERCGGR
jgi:acyl-CoA synthetase (NDP forming)